MNKVLAPGKTSRRRFVQLAGGLALSLRHGLLPAQAGTGAPALKDRAAAAVEDSALRIEWDVHLHTRVSRRTGQRWLPMTEWGSSEYLLRDDARHIADFAIAQQAQDEVDDVNGAGTRLTLSGIAAEGPMWSSGSWRLTTARTRGLEFVICPWAPAGD